MTHKEKAIELVRKMYVVCSNSASDITLYFAKQCALIAVDEIWNELESARVFEEYDYWQEVKQEIEKL
jgi:2-hydroxy-3-keto-5-methylthiopentenyl-1-phosphate phosphatase